MFWAKPYFTTKDTKDTKKEEEKKVSASRGASAWPVLLPWCSWCAWW
jgi:hypothetical protein